MMAIHYCRDGTFGVASSVGRPLPPLLLLTKKVTRTKQLRHGPVDLWIGTATLMDSLRDRGREHGRGVCLNEKTPRRLIARTRAVVVGRRRGRRRERKDAERKAFFLFLVFITLLPFFSLSVLLTEGGGMVIKRRCLSVYRYVQRRWLVGGYVF